MIATLALALLVTGTDQPALIAAAASRCASFPLRSTGTIHYFCDCKAGAQSGCVPGDDASDGLTPATAKRRWYTALTTFNAMNAGDTVALCRGGAWNLDVATSSCGISDPGSAHDAGVAYVQNTRCAAGTDLNDPLNTSTCDIRDYPAPWGGTSKPLLAVPPSVTGETLILGRNGSATSGVRVLNLELRGNNAGPRGGTYNPNTGLYWGSCGPTTDADWLVCNDTFSNFAIALHMQENGARGTRMHLRGNRILMSWLDGILGGPGSRSEIDANFFDNNGGWGSPWGPAHTLYPNGTEGSPGAQIVNNEIRYSAVTCQNAIISGHGAWDGLNVENNLIDCGASPVPGCWATKLDSGNDSGNGPHYQRNAHVHRNLIFATSVGIGLGQAPGTVVENNVIVMKGGATDWMKGVLIPSEESFGWDATSDVQVRNNTIYMPVSDANGAGIELGLAGETETGHVLANNAVYTGGPLSTCFLTPQASSAYAFVGANACFGGTWGTSFDVTAHLTADPLFVNAPADLSLQPTSPLLRAADPSHAPAVDFLGASRPGLPAIGALDAGGPSGGTSSGGTSSGGTSSGGAGAGGGSGGGGCDTSAGRPGALAGLMLLALLAARRRARFRA